ncbi:MAG TPA: 2OG-Fe(II) oxygenase [Candidatus Baltobacteraceae bacterium]|nr:2OG-Fe(II) oxygenase [Candidatus Baltobacteraceae bacterium]
MNLSALATDGFALVPSFIESDTANELRAMYDDDAAAFRSRIVMQRHAFGRGEYKYFANPLPPAIGELRERLYAALAPTANEWASQLRLNVTFPSALGEFLERCFASDQRRPTPLLLKYRAGDYNCLHQDLYGPVTFPLQATIYLSRPGNEFDGGEVVLSEQRPRAQTRVHVLQPRQGDLLVLPSHSVPRQGTRGTYRAAFKHGVGTVRRGTRYVLGVVFHEAL